MSIIKVAWEHSHLNYLRTLCRASLSTKITIIILRSSILIYKSIHEIESKDRVTGWIFPFSFPAWFWRGYFPAYNSLRQQPSFFSSTKFLIIIPQHQRTQDIMSTSSTPSSNTANKPLTTHITEQEELIRNMKLANEAVTEKDHTFEWRLWEQKEKLRQLKAKKRREDLNTLLNKFKRKVWSFGGKGKTKEQYILYNLYKKKIV